MRCENHPRRRASGLYLIPYLGAKQWLCSDCENGALRDFGEIRQVEVSGSWPEEETQPCG